MWCHDAPGQTVTFLAKVPLEETVRCAIDEIGPPMRMSREVKLGSDGGESSVQLVPWQVETAYARGQTDSCIPHAPLTIC